MRTTERRPLRPVLTTLTIVLLAAGCHRAQTGASPAPAPGAAVVPASSSSLGQLSHELDRLQNEVQGKNREIATLVRRYQEEGGRLPDSFGPDLTDEQKALLAKRFQEERLGTRALLQDILDRDTQIKELKERIGAVEAGLPLWFPAQKGERQEDIVRRFLTQKAVPEAEAARLISEVHMQRQPLLAGHRVWAYLKDGVLGTWVTTGDAPISPQELDRRAWRTLTDQRDSARREVASLRHNLEVVTQDRTDLKHQLEVLRNDIGGWNDEIEKLRQEARASRQGARYVAGSKKQLREHGIISGGLFHRAGVRRLERLETLDLAQTNEIVLKSSEHGLDRIQKVNLLPDGFRRDQDYAVQLMRGGTVARLSLLDVDKFKRSTFVVVLE